MNFSISRIILYVHDTDLLKDFYQQHFHFHVIEEIPGEWVLMHAGGVQLALHLAGEAFRNTHSEELTNASNCKLVLTVNENLEKIRQRMVGAGVFMKPIKSYEGFPYDLCDGKDPEGNVFQLMQPA